jgi:hypothetical protein
MKSFFGKQILPSAVALLILTAVSPQITNAQFVTQDVFSPANFAMFGKIWNEDVSTGVKMSQELQQGLKIYQNAVQIYGLASQEASYLRNKQILLAAGFLAQHAMIPGQPGWDKALTAVGGIANAGRVWQQMTASGGRNSFQALNARIQMADSFGAAALNAIGSCNAAAAQSDGSIASLEMMAIDLNPAANTRANQANLSNMGQTQQLRIQECQHNIQLQQAKLQALQTMAQRARDQQMATMFATDQTIRFQITVTDTNAALKGLIDR